MRIGELFAGYGGLGMGIMQAMGGEIAWVSDIDAGANKILAHRFPGVPNYGDVTTLDWSTVEPVDVLAGGTPCQDLSHAGKREGMTEGTRSNLWVAMREGIAQLKPQHVVWENVRGALSAKADSEVGFCAGCMGTGNEGAVLRALGRVLGDLSDLGYDCQWRTVRASDIGAPHERQRVFILATNTRSGSDNSCASDANTDSSRCGEHGRSEPVQQELDTAQRSGNTASDTSGQRHGVEQDDRVVGRMGAETGSERRSGSTSRAESGDRGQESRSVNWGKYRPAIHQWERILGRSAPHPTITGKNDKPVLSPLFVEWMMGLPFGWVAETPGITKNQAIKALGNGVVPQQAAHAISQMLTYVSATNGATT